MPNPPPYHPLPNHSAGRGGGGGHRELSEKRIQYEAVLVRAGLRGLNSAVAELHQQWMIAAKTCPTKPPNGSGRLLCVLHTSHSRPSAASAPAQKRRKGRELEEVEEPNPELIVEFTDDEDEFEEE